MGLSEAVAQGPCFLSTGLDKQMSLSPEPSEADSWVSCEATSCVESCNLEGWERRNSNQWRQVETPKLDRTVPGMAVQQRLQVQGERQDSSQDHRTGDRAQGKEPAYYA